jgi:hypothetical protein
MNMFREMESDMAKKKNCVFKDDQMVDEIGVSKHIKLISCIAESMYDRVDSKYSSTTIPYNVEKTRSKKNKKKNEIIEIDDEVEIMEDEEIQVIDKGRIGTVPMEDEEIPIEEEDFIERIEGPLDDEIVDESVCIGSDEIELTDEEDRIHPKDLDDYEEDEFLVKGDDDITSITPDEDSTFKPHDIVEDEDEDDFIVDECNEDIDDTNGGYDDEFIIDDEIIIDDELQDNVSGGSGIEGKSRTPEEVSEEIQEDTTDDVEVQLIKTVKKEGEKTTNSSDNSYLAIQPIPIAGNYITVNRDDIDIVLEGSSVQQNHLKWPSLLNVENLCLFRSQIDDKIVYVPFIKVNDMLYTVDPDTVHFKRLFKKKYQNDPLKMKYPWFNLNSESRRDRALSIMAFAHYYRGINTSDFDPEELTLDTKSGTVQFSLPISERMMGLLRKWYAHTKEEVEMKKTKGDIHLDNGFEYQWKRRAIEHEKERLAMKIRHMKEELALLNKHSV